MKKRKGEGIGGDDKQAFALQEFGQCITLEAVKELLRCISYHDRVPFDGDR